MISHHHKCVFVHIPKTAGQSIEHVFLKWLNLTWENRAPLLLRPNDNPELGPPRLAHLKADEYVHYKYLTQDMFDDYFKFAFVRNPWSRVVSIYKHLGFNKKCDFKTFLMSHFKNTIFEDMHWFVGPQSEYLLDVNGELLVDFVGKFEALQSDFDQVCERLGLPKAEVPHINKAKENGRFFGLKPRELAKSLVHVISKRNYPSYTQYQDYYDQQSRDLIEDLYASDIELFNYEFGESRSA